MTSPVRVRPRLAQERAGLAGLLSGTGPPPVALVPTMGALHDGHRALLRAARARAGTVVVTIFVNPLQFAPGEDLDRYPRTLDADLQICADEAVDVVFAPPVAEVYPRPPRVTVTAGPMGSLLCGADRPGHFDGVLTVVAKLLHLVRPDLAVFGEKDAQQLALVRAMVADLDVGVEVLGVPTVRDSDGLALSSRNAYLSPAERQTALALPAALRAGAAAATAGPDAVRRAAKDVLAPAGDGLRVEYLSLVDPVSLADLGAEGGPALLAVAAVVGSTRLIDNVRLTVTGDNGPSTVAGEPGQARTHQEP